MSVKTERIARTIQVAASEAILHELKDPRASFVTITKVKVTEDLHHATIFYSVLGTKADRNKAARLLDHARGFLQARVASRLRTRVTPQISFRFDDSIEGSIRVSGLIDRAVAEDEERRRARGEREPGSGDAPPEPAGDGGDPPDPPPEGGAPPSS